MADIAGALRQRVFAEPGARLAAGACCLIVTATLGAEWLAPFDGREILDPVLLRSQRPSWTHLLGTDPYGRDLFSRLLVGGRVTLLLAITSVVMSTLIGVLVGVSAGMSGGYVDRVLMRLAEVGLAVPRTLLLLVLVSLWDHTGLGTLIVLLGGSGWMGMSRLVRGEIRALLVQDRIVAARALGVAPLALAFRHLLPAVLPLIIVWSTGSLAQTLLLESGLSFLGLGVRPPDASWGAILRDVSDVVGEARWLALGPGALLVVMVVSIQRLGDAMQAVLLRERAAR